MKKILLIPFIFFLFLSGCGNANIDRSTPDNVIKSYFKYSQNITNYRLTDKYFKTFYSDEIVKEWIKYDKEGKDFNIELEIENLTQDTDTRAVAIIKYYENTYKDKKSNFKIILSKDNNGWFFEQIYDTCYYCSGKKVSIDYSSSESTLTGEDICKKCNGTGWVNTDYLPLP